MEITRREMRLWQDGPLAKGLSPKTIQNIRGETVSPIVEAAYEVDPRAADLLLMLLATGMRRGEAAGLRYGR